MFSSRKIDLAVLLAVCFVAFWWRLGTLGLIDPDEPFYAQTAREMVATGDWVTPQIYGAPQFEKPIFYYWLVAASFKALGETEFAGRMPTAVFATALVLLVGWFGARVWNRRTGFLGALVLATGLEFCVMSRLMLTDVPLATFLAAALFCYWLGVKEEAQRDKWMFWHLVWAGLAVLTKGPLGSLVTVLATVAFSLGMKRAVLYRGRGFLVGRGGVRGDRGAVVCGDVCVAREAVLGGVFHPRQLAAGDPGGASVEQPCVVLCGAAVPRLAAVDAGGGADGAARVGAAARG